MKYPDPVEIIARIDERIDEFEAELEGLVSSECPNYLFRSDETAALVAEKRATLGYLRSHGKTEVMVNYCGLIVDELNRSQMAQKLNESKQNLTKLRRSLGRLQTAIDKYWMAVRKGQEIFAKKPEYFSTKGSYRELARRVCEALEWPESRIRSVRRDLRDAGVIPEGV